MSLILEALRKSEAERRRGSTPDVAMELPPIPAARARRDPAWLLPAAAVGALVVLAAWWWSQREARAVEAAVGDATAPIAAPHVEPRAPAVVVARPVAAPLRQATEPPPPAIAATPPARTTAAIPAPPPVLPPAPAPTPAAQPVVADIDATSMPAVKLSMHMWDESSARRFVILNGQRMAEGDRSGEVTVVAIERDGVVLERNGQRARVPLP